MSTTEEKQLPKDLAAEQSMVNVQVDGNWIQVPKGTRMIEACKIANKDVPHYCYHPKLSSPGNCRMCLVQMGMPPRLRPGDEPTYNEEGYQEIGWMPRGVIACANTVAENMGIRTSGELVEDFRNGVMEFLLINHPLDCPICDQAGECRLQEFSVTHGRGGSRFVDDKIKKPKNVDIGERVRLDDERCIMCSRCIRFMDEVAGDPCLGFTERGTHTTLAVHPGKRLDSNYSLNTVDICPVGALTSNDFRFQMRVWFLKETPSIDVNCGTGSNTTIWSRGDEVYRITPRQNDAVNSCWMPDSHRLNFKHLHDDARLTDPMSVSQDNKHEVISWMNAISKLSDQLNELDASETAVIGSARMTNEELYLLKLFVDAAGISHFSLAPRDGESDGMLISADRNPNTTGAQLILNGNDPYRNFNVIKSEIGAGTIKNLIVLEEDLITDHAFPQELLDKLELLVSTNMTANPTASASDLVLPTSGFAEKSGTMVNVTGRLQKLNKAVNAPGNSKSVFELLSLLLTELGMEVPSSPVKVFKAISETNTVFAEQSYATIGEQGVVITETETTIPLIEREQARIAAREIVG